MLMDVSSACSVHARPPASPVLANDGDTLNHPAIRSPSILECMRAVGARTRCVRSSYSNAYAGPGLLASYWATKGRAGAITRSEAIFQTSPSRRSTNNTGERRDRPAKSRLFTASTSATSGVINRMD
jgi:hypothetical protein